MDFLSIDELPIVSAVPERDLPSNRLNGHTGYGDGITSNSAGYEGLGICRLPYELHTKFIALNGYVDPNDEQTDVFFEIGLTTNYTHEIVAQVTDVPTYVSVKLSPSGFKLNTEYHFRIKAISARGVSYGKDMAFIISTANKNGIIRRITCFFKKYCLYLFQKLHNVKFRAVRGIKPAPQRYFPRCSI